MLKAWNYHNPVKIVSGPKCLSALKHSLNPGRWLLITSEGFSRRGITAKLQSLCPDIDLVVYDQVTPNPELDKLEVATTNYRTQQIQGVLALGGGSVLDAAKVLAVTLHSDLDKPLTEVLRRGLEHQWAVKLPLVVIPTTSGTGAEVTPFATVWDRTEHKKYSVTGDKIFPDIALLDPELTLTLPRYETLYTALDAISHALESLWNVNRTPISESFALQALGLSEEFLPLVLTDPENLHARAALQNASLLAGLAISQTRTAIAHSISYPLTSRFSVPHGLACSFTLPSIIDIYLEKSPGERFESIMIRIRELLTSLHLYVHMKEYVDQEKINTLTKEMFHPDRIGNFTHMINPQELERIISLKD